MIDGTKITSSRSPRQWQAYLNLQAGKGRRAEDLVAEVVAAGYTQAEAVELAGPAGRSHTRRLARTLGCSTLMVVCGVLFTISSYTTAASSGAGSQYFIWFGAVLCGIIGIVYSLVQLARKRR